MIAIYKLFGNVIYMYVDGMRTRKRDICRLNKRRFKELTIF